MEVIPNYFLLITALIWPLMKCVAQAVVSSSMGRGRVYPVLSRINYFFGFMSILITGVVLLKFFGISDAQSDWIIQYKGKIPLRFTLSHLSLLFWSSKNVMIFLIEIFSLRYFFNEPGLGKFNFTISMFSFALNLVFLSGSFAPFTLGWELMGLASVILIAYFDHRRVSVERSFLALLFYKLGDFFLLAGLLYIANTTTVESFGDFRELVDSNLGVWILCLFILAAFVKSGLLPFSFWLPRAMEGPTPSSALFYGALSAHAGVFLILRVTIAMGGMPAIPMCLILLCAGMTSIFAYLMAITQTDVKNQIMYSTLSQISVIFIEIALGWTSLAQVHCILHMFFRLFQFLMAPSAIYLSHEKDFLGVSSVKSPKWSQLIWWLSINEFGLAILWRKVAVEPILWVGQLFTKINRRARYLLKQTLPLSLRSMERKNNDGVRYLLFIFVLSIPIILKSHMHVSVLGIVGFQVIALIFSLMTIEEKKISQAFFNLIFSGAFLVVSYYFSVKTEHIEMFYTHLGFTTLGFSLLGALFIYFRNAFHLPDGHDFFGLYRVSPFLASLFAMLILFVMGFPGFSTYFSYELISEDLSHTSAFAGITGLVILNINAYLWFNIYTKLFWGAGPQHLHISDL